jgi:chitinase
VVQNDWDFTKYDVQFAGSNPPTTTTTPPVTTTPPSGTCSAAAYNNATAYTGGQQVSYGGHTWTAKWWTQGEVPSTGGSGVWQDNGPCSGGPSPTTSATGGGQCAGVTAYNNATAYTGGQSVTYNGRRWTTKWWTQGEVPSTGGTGVWADNGAC